MVIRLIRSISKVVFSLMLLTGLSALESFKVTPSVNTYVSLIFNVCILYPSSVARLKGIGDKGYVKAAARSIIRLLAMEKASKDVLVNFYSCLDVFQFHNAFFQTLECFLAESG